jgi:predicted transcriptional regulator
MVPDFWHYNLDIALQGCHFSGMANSPSPNIDLSRRERQILEALYRLGRATAAEVREALADPPTYTAVRTHLTNLEAKSQIRFYSDGTRYIYEPVVPRQEMAKKVMDDVLKTFFDDRIDLVVATLISRDEQVSDDQLDRLSKLIEQARQEGR